MRKDDAINMINNSDPSEKCGVLLLYIKMSECNSAECNSIGTTYYQKNRDVKLNRAKDYYKNGKERLRDHARHKYRNFSEE